MSNVSLLTLPVEVLYRIFDYLDIVTILRSLRLVCTKLYPIVSTYNRYELDLTSIPKSKFELVSRLVRPDSVISLILPDGTKETSGNIGLFLSSFDLFQFTRLRSLTLGEVNNDELEQFAKYISSCSLVSLSITFRKSETGNDRMIAFVSSAIARSKLRKLNLNTFDQIIEQITWPNQCALRYLTMKTCTYHEYNLILRSLPQLRTFTMIDCIMDDSDAPVSSSSGSVFYLQLMSLTMGGCRLPMEDIQSVLSLTPSLVHLKLVSVRSTFDSAFDGDVWKKFIRTKLILLDRFQFFFTYHLGGNTGTPSLTSVIVPFRDQFWRIDKRWFVTSDYIITSAQITLYTIPIHTVHPQILIRCDASSNDDRVRLLASCWTNDMINITTAEFLTTLDLGSNEMGNQGTEYLADALRNNKTLTKLYLRHNGIRSSGVQHLANVLRNNSTLTTLDLGSNRIEDTGEGYLNQPNVRPRPRDHFETRLSQIYRDPRRRTIHFRDWNLDENLSPPTSPTAPTTHNLGYNQIGTSGTKHLADALRHNKTLTTLNLEDNQIENEGAQHIADALENNTTIISLHLGRNRITYQGARHLADALRINPTLTTLNLEANEIGSLGAEYLAVRLQRRTKLTTLNLGQNQIGDKGAEHLADALRNNATLTTLNLEANEIGPSGAEHLAHELRNNTTLIALNLEDNRIATQGAKALADALRNNQTLTTLYLGHNQIGEGVKDLADTLRNNRTLTTLNLRDNQIGPSEAHYLADALRNNTTLTTLNLEDNRIGEGGAENLASALQNNTMLTTLYLRHNGIGTSGAQHLADGIHRNTTLTTLYLEDNGLGDQGAEHLADALQNNTTLIALCLWSNQIGHDLRRRIDELIERNTQMKNQN